jgi:predicted nucleic acid-binding protein
MDYSKRRLTDVTVHALQIIREDIGMAAGRVTLQISNHIDEDDGPYITVDLAVPFDSSKSIQDAELALLNGSRSLLGRLMEFSKEDCTKSLLRPREPSLIAQPSS